VARKSTSGWPNFIEEARQGLGGLALLDIAPGGSRSRTQSAMEHRAGGARQARSWTASALAPRIWGGVTTSNGRKAARNRVLTAPSFGRRAGHDRKP
jgi:hypothetical protein